MKQCTSYEVVCSYLPPNLRASMNQVSPEAKEKVNEIRIRVGRPISFVFSDKTLYLKKSGMLEYSHRANDLLITEKRDIDNITASLCKFSIHSCSRELTDAFFSIENGIRVGVAGTYSTFENGVIKYVNSLNFRISRQIKGCAEELYNKIFAAAPKSVLICGGVNSGKATILRDLCRLCGEKYKTSLIGERREFSAIANGIPTNDVGIQTDILDGCRRSYGIISAIRTLSPTMIFCDEISTQEDAEAILNGYGCRVKFAATIHAGSLTELYSRNAASSLLERGVFDYAVMLEGEGMPGKIREIRRISKNA